MMDQRRSAIMTMAVMVCCATVQAEAAVTKIDLKPVDVGSSSSSVFSTLPSDDPMVFGFSLAGTQVVDFDRFPSNAPVPDGTALTNQYAAVGVTMSGFRADASVYGGPASSPNTTFGPGQVFTFTVPVVAVGIINTSPDKDLVQIYSGPNATGTLLLSFNDSEGEAKNFNRDRFVGAFATGGDGIGSIRFSNGTGDLELDELMFTVPEPASLALLTVGVVALPRRR